MKLSSDDLVNKWLGDYHSTSIEQVLLEHPEWSEGNHSREFYSSYMVTQEQHDEWREWAIKEIMKKQRLSRKRVERGWWAVYLNTSPQVIPDKI